MVMTLIVFICGIFGVLASGRKDMGQSLSDLFCQSCAVYGALLAAGPVIDLIPELPVFCSDFVRTAVGLFLPYVIFLLFFLKLAETIVTEQLIRAAEQFIPEKLDKLFSKCFGFLSGCAFAMLLSVIILWGAVSFKLPLLEEKSFRDSVHAHSVFYIGTMNVFTWSTSCMPMQKKMLEKLFPRAENAAPKDKLSSLSDEDKKALQKKKDKKGKKKKKKKSSSKPKEKRSENKETVPENDVEKGMRKGAFFPAETSLRSVYCMNFSRFFSYWRGGAA